MKFNTRKYVAVATILSLVCVISITKTNKSSSDSYVSPARLIRDEEVQRLNSMRNTKKKRDAGTLKVLDETEDIWLRQSVEQHAALKEMVGRESIISFFDILYQLTLTLSLLIIHSSTRFVNSPLHSRSKTWSVSLFAAGRRR